MCFSAYNTLYLVLTALTTTRCTICAFFHSALRFLTFRSFSCARKGGFMMTTVAVRGREPLFKIDLSKSFDQQTIVGHNRWHPDIPPVLSVKPDNVFRIECKDWTDGQIKDDDSANDVRDVHLQ